MASVAALYSPDVLALATSLAAYRMDEGLSLHGFARSASCGSTLTAGLVLDGEGRIERIGLSAQACAIGQAAAAIMATAASGKTQQDFAAAEAAIAAWLAGSHPMPDWPSLEGIAAAKEFPARHGAILLGWRAGLDAFAAGQGV